MQPSELKIAVGDQEVSGLLLRPENAKALYIFAHGAGAGMTHAAMVANAQGLAAHGVATLRYQFLYMEKGSKRPDAPRLAHQAVRAAAAEANRLLPELPLFAGGRSFGGRMTSQTQAESPLPGVRGLAFLGFPLHPAGKPGSDRADHLTGVDIPMLFISGSRDALADTPLLEAMVANLGARATLELVEHADHSFKFAAKSGRTTEEVEAQILGTFSSWIDRILGSG
jgi:predicted alpha/beta-hydrolase family hydrolase